MQRIVQFLFWHTRSGEEVPGCSSMQCFSSFLDFSPCFLFCHEQFINFLKFYYKKKETKLALWHTDITSKLPGKLAHLNTSLERGEERNWVRIGQTEGFNTSLDKVEEGGEIVETTRCEVRGVWLTAASSDMARNGNYRSLIVIFSKSFKNHELFLFPLVLAFPACEIPHMSSLWILLPEHM